MRVLQVVDAGGRDRDKRGAHARQHAQQEKRRPRPVARHHERLHPVDHAAGQKGQAQQTHAGVAVDTHRHADRGQKTPGRRGNEDRRQASCDLMEQRDEKMRVEHVHEGRG